MLNTQDGKDYRYYQIYIWGGLAAIVIYISVVGLLDLTKNFRTLMIIINIPITVWFLGVLVYWWWVFLFKGRRRPEDTDESRQKKKGRLNSLKNWSTLYDSMMESGGDSEEIEAYDKASRRPLLIWYGLQNLLCLWILGNFWVWTLFQDKLPENYIKSVWVPGVLIISFVLLLSPFFLFRFLGGDPHAFLRPLGLYDGESPPDTFSSSGPQVYDKNSDKEGTKIIYGKRKDRNIYIETLGKHSFTGVEGKTPSFKIINLNGKLECDEHTPAVIKDLIRKFPKAKRWKGITVKGNEDGISIERNSRGQNMWLYDLWLTEQIFTSLSSKTF